MDQELDKLAAYTKAVGIFIAYAWFLGFIAFIVACVITVIGEVTGFFDWWLLEHMEWNYEHIAEAKLKGSEVTFDKIVRYGTSICFISVNFIFGIAVIGFSAYEAKKKFNSELETQRWRILNTPGWENADKIVANFPDSSEEAYGELLEVNGCGSATAKRIIEKCKDRRELTEHEIDILSKACLYGLSRYHPL